MSNHKKETPVHLVVTYIKRFLENIDRRLYVGLFVVAVISVTVMAAVWFATDLKNDRFEDKFVEVTTANEQGDFSAAIAAAEQAKPYAVDAGHSLGLYDEVLKALTVQEKQKQALLYAESYLGHYSGSDASYPLVLDRLAQAHYLTGDFKRAVAAQEKLVDLYENQEDYIFPYDKAVAEANLTTFKDNVTQIEEMETSGEQ